LASFAKFIKGTAILKAFGFDGRERSWKLSKCIVSGDQQRPRSKLHILARKLLHEEFQYDTILEEVPLPGSHKPSRKSTLFVDFLIPSSSLAVEVHGRQHFEFVAHFHGDTRGFRKSKARDRDKARWLEINSIDLITLSYSETEDEWRQRIINR
jgi:very-short-patch-repair endonuclease